VGVVVAGVLGAREALRREFVRDTVARRRAAARVRGFCFCLCGCWGRARREFVREKLARRELRRAQNVCACVRACVHACVCMCLCAKVAWPRELLRAGCVICFFNVDEGVCLS